MRMKPPAKLLPLLFTCLVWVVLVGCARPETPAPPQMVPRFHPAAQATPPAGSHNIILISLDTLRADRLSCYGNKRRTSPFIDSLAARSVRFANCYSQAHSTAPSHMTMFTGLYPTQHNVRFIQRTVSFTRLDPETPIITQLLHAAGYRTAAFHSGGQISGATGMNRGFDVFNEGNRDLSPQRLEQVKAWLAVNGGQKFFLFLHTYQIHAPYLPPPPFDKRFDPGYKGWITPPTKYLAHVGGPEFDEACAAFWGKPVNHLIDTKKFNAADLRYLLSLYDGNIAYVDDQLKGWFAWMEQQPWWDNTVVIITADHGEEFLEHGYFTHTNLYVETLHVPLIIHVPGAKPRVDTGLVRLVDLAPTILQLAGLSPPRTMMGHSLKPRLTGPAPGETLVLSQDPWDHNKPHSTMRDGHFCLYLKGDKP